MLTPGITKEIESALRKHAPKRVLLQAPEGFKTRIEELAEAIEKKGVEAVIWADPCFGACDIPDSAAKSLGCDLIIHVGHAPMGARCGVPVAYVEYRTPKDFAGILKKNIRIFGKSKNLGIATTVQHIQDIEPAKEFLKMSGFKVLVGKSKSLKYPGQVLGCDAEAAKSIEDKVDAFLFLGSGRFHALGILKKVSKPVFIADYEKNEVYDITPERKLLEKKRIMRRMRLNEAKSIALLVSVKKGQMPKADIFALKKKLELRGKKVKIIAMDYITPEKILGMKFDVLVNCACPRIEDDIVFRETIISLDEIWELVQ